MSEKETFIEISGPSVEEAIERGLLALGVAKEDVDVTVVDEGRSGFLGIGNREATVTLRVKRQAIAADLPPAAPAPESPPVSAATVETEVDDDGDEFFDDLEDLPDPDLLEEEEMAREIITGLFGHMDFEVEVESRLGETDDLGKQAVQIDITGDDLGDLIGPRGEGLLDLQYLTRLMVSQALRRRVNFLVDVNAYRQRKEEGLVKLAERMASKVVDRGKPVTLEPMNSYERRLIHLALRDRQDVYTKSVGEGHSRRVRINPRG